MQVFSKRDQGYIYKYFKGSAIAFEIIIYKYYTGMFKVGKF